MQIPGVCLWKRPLPSLSHGWSPSEYRGASISQGFPGGGGGCGRAHPLIVFPFSNATICQGCHPGQLAPFLSLTPYTQDILHATPSYPLRQCFWTRPVHSVCIAKPSASAVIPAFIVCCEHVAIACVLRWCLLLPLEGNSTWGIYGAHHQGARCWAHSTGPVALSLSVSLKFTVFFFFFWIEIYLIQHKIYHLKVYMSVHSSTFTELCNHHQCLIPECPHHPRKKPLAHEQSVALSEWKNAVLLEWEDVGLYSWSGAWNTHLGECCISPVSKDFFSPSFLTT